MIVFGEGLIGLRDLFIHADYISAAPIPGLFDRSFVPLFVGALVFMLSAYAVYLAYKDRKRKRRDKRREEPAR